MSDAPDADAVTPVVCHVPPASSTPLRPSDDEGPPPFSGPCPTIHSNNPSDLQPFSSRNSNKEGASSTPQSFSASKNDDLSAGSMGKNETSVPAAASSTKNDDGGSAVSSLPHAWHPYEDATSHQVSVESREKSDDGSTAISTAINTNTFPHVLHGILSNPAYQTFARWNAAGDEFTIYDTDEFCENILPGYFKGENPDFFFYKMGRWGFKKSSKCITKGTNRGKAYLIYSHKCKYFTRDNPELISYMIEDCSWVTNRSNASMHTMRQFRPLVDIMTIHAPAPSPARYKSLHCSKNLITGTPVAVHDPSMFPILAERYKNAEIYKEFAEAGGENAYAHPHHHHYAYPHHAYPYPPYGGWPMFAPPPQHAVMQAPMMPPMQPHQPHMMHPQHPLINNMMMPPTQQGMMHPHQPMMHPQQTQEPNYDAMAPPPGKRLKCKQDQVALQDELAHAPTDNSAERHAELALQELGYVSDGDRHADL